MRRVYPSTGWPVLENNSIGRIWSSNQEVGSYQTEQRSCIVKNWSDIVHQIVTRQRRSITQYIKAVEQITAGLYIVESY